MTNATNTASAATLLDLADIQGGILRTYGDGFPKGRNFYLTVRDERKGREQEAHEGVSRS